jgi:ribonuclease Z
MDAPTADDSPMSLTLTLLGTGTPAPSARRAGSGYLVRFGGRSLLFDCGPGAYFRLLQAGVSPGAISHLFLTHLHYDHCADYGVLELVRWDQSAGKADELEVIGPSGTRQMSARLFGTDGVYAADIAARTGHPASREIFERRGGRGVRRAPAPVVTEWSDGLVYRGDSWHVRAAPMVHCEPHLITLAYRLETPFGTVVFGADTAPNPRLTELAQGADVLVHMCHFFNGPGVDPRLSSSCSGHLDAAATAHAADVQKLVLVHLAPELDAPGSRERALQEAAETFAGPIVFGDDLLTIVVPGRPQADAAGERPDASGRTAQQR